MRTDHCSVLELRDYTLQPGQRDTLIDLFEREFIEPQEAAGMRLIASFRDCQRPDHFVWLRGFADMAARQQALQTFYGGAVWAAHREAANATMVDSDNVLLLRPLVWSSAIDSLGHQRGPATDDSTARTSSAVFELSVYPLRRAPSAAELHWFQHTLLPTAVQSGASLRGAWVTETAQNSYPRLLVREGEQMLAWLAAFPDAVIYQRYLAALDACSSWRRQVQPRLDMLTSAPVQRLLLQATARSLLRH